MTPRKNRRELERTIDALEAESTAEGDLNPLIAYQTEDGYVDADGEALPTDDHGALDVEQLATGPVVILDGEYTTVPSEEGGGS
jgi:hypothetical protein